MKATTEAFLRLLAWRPHRAIAIAYWYLTNRKVRARNRLRQAVGLAPFGYTILLRQREKAAAADPALRRLVSAWPDRPMFTLVLPEGTGADRAWVSRLIHVVRDQPYDRWEMLVAGTGIASWEGEDARIRLIDRAVGDMDDPLAAAIAAARGDFVIPLAPGTLLDEAALLRLAEAVRGAPHSLVFYGDEDRIDPAGRRSQPWFKPLWNAELALALDYIAPACALETMHARAALADTVYHASPSVYALVLAMTKKAPLTDADAVVHVPHLLVSKPLAGKDLAQPSRVLAVAERVAPDGAVAEAGPFGTVVVRWPLPNPPPGVTILIPTRDKAELVRACVDSLLEATRYPNFTVVIIDNGSTDAETLAYFKQVTQDARVTVLPCDLPYNFAAINNVAVEQSAGDYLCFLNNDTVIIDGDWLTELMRYAVRPGIGAVGAQLLYEDHSIQHAGVVIGLGGAAGHAHRGLRPGEIGYFAQAHAAHFASAVTAACMVVERAKFLAVGGFDADHLSIAYNDVDLCLKLGRAGWRNVYAPQAKLLHLETKSRGADLSPAHIERYSRELAILQERWGTKTYIDPLHHPALDRGSETYRIAF